jgi:formylglycine-generating enzyme required for sulfatase activity
MNPFEARDIWPPGTVVDRKYVIDSTLGRGSFGTAYRCHHRVLARTYVIKRLHGQFAEDPNYVQKFIQEARAIEKLKGCPQIVEIYDMTQTEDGHLILVMENMVGGDLEALIRRVGNFKIEDAVWYALKISEGLAAAHAAGLVHRDVKPENVLLGADPREAKLTDFGIVAERDTASPTSVLRGGSIGYAAPEQWHLAGKYLDGRADLYALGATLFRMLVGHMPFGEIEIGLWIERVRTTQAPPLRALRADVPEAVERLVNELLSTDRDLRPASAVVVIDRLKALKLAEMPVQGRKPTLEEAPNPKRKTEELGASYGDLRAATPIPPPPPSRPAQPQYPPPPAGSGNPSPIPVHYQSSPQPHYQPQQPPQYQAPSYQPSPYQSSAYPLPQYQTSPYQTQMPPPPAVPKRKSWMWVVVLPLIGALAAGGWWIFNNRPPKKNPKDSLTYVWVPAGKFIMGCDDKDCRADEKPAHEVTITKGFYLGETEVTVGAYKRFTAATGIAMPVEPSWTPPVIIIPQPARPLNEGWRSLDSPMVEVSWNTATRYCDWVGGRLPSEAEWEYAARAGTTTIRYGDLDSIAWYADNSGVQHIDSLAILNSDTANYENRVMGNGDNFHAVGQKAANDFGLHDMIGNVWEWVADYYDEKYYSTSTAEDPKGAREGANRVGRGGSYFMHPKRSTVTARSPQKSDYQNPGFGFRCAWDAKLF